VLILATTHKNYFLSTLGKINLHKSGEERKFPLADTFFFFCTPPLHSLNAACLTRWQCSVQLVWII